MTFAVICEAVVYPLPWGPKPQFIDANGNPMSSGTLTFYAAGSSTPQNTYTSSTGSVANSNPVTLDSRGESPNEIWLTGGQTYKVVLKDSSGATVWTVDNVSGINDTSASFDQWVAGPTPTYVSATSFTLAGDQTSAFHVGRRLKSTNSGGTIYSRISASVFGASTTVTVVNDSGTLDAGLSAVSYGLLSATNPSGPVRRDDTFLLADNSDPTKLLAFQLSGITTGTTRTVTVEDASFTVGKLPTRQVLTSGSGATYTTPAGARLLVVRVKGGGGGGGGGSDSTANSTSGGAGTASSFNSIDAAGGGLGVSAAGGGSSGSSGGTGGAGTASFRLAGAPGHPPTWPYGNSTSAVGIGGAGGGQGGGKGGVSTTGTAGVANSGGGGGGGAPTISFAFANVSAAKGGGGGGEGESIEIRIASPSATYTYTVGAGGTAGAAGTNGAAGGAGGSGVIIVDEYY